MRWYSSTMGLLISLDPIRFRAGDINLYRFVGNSTFEWMDPYGLACFKTRPLDGLKIGKYRIKSNNRV